jgi:hypothetical protein
MTIISVCLLPSASVNSFYTATWNSSAGLSLPESVQWLYYRPWWFIAHYSSTENVSPQPKWFHAILPTVAPEFVAKLSGNMDSSSIFFATQQHWRLICNLIIPSRHIGELFVFSSDGLPCRVSVLVGSFASEVHQSTA